MILPIFKKQTTIKPLLLLVLDGFGVAPDSEGNTITRARTPCYDKLLNDYPSTQLIASGESVGLPANEVGNTEVGHLTIGAGRVILQDLKRINLAIEKGTFFNNKALLQAASHVSSNNSNLHIMGLIGSGRVHSSVDHLFTLLQFCKKESVEDVYLHLFTDGRDSPPNEGVEIIKKIEDFIKTIKVGRIATISGRYWAMDRDRRWDRTQKAYNALVKGEGVKATSATQAVKQAYESNRTDEFIQPTVILGQDQKAHTVNDNDAVVFYNFRVDRPKQLTMVFVLPDFENLKTFDFGYDTEKSREIGEVEISGTFDRGKVPQNVFFVTMTEYQKNLPVSAVAFGPEVVDKPLGELLSQAGLKQLHMAESEKERFVKYYFNGMREKPLEGEDDLIVASPKVETYDKRPQMSLPGLTEAFLKQLKKDKYHFFIINFANPDMVAHSGNLPATIKAIEYVDKYLGKAIDGVLKAEGTVFLTADHGNAEELITYPSSTYFFTSNKGVINTDHSNNPVPFLVINANFKGMKVNMPAGALGDIAPTVLDYLGIAVPEVMTGRNLLAGINKKP